jgi:nicotinamidase-related amidase
MNVRQTAQGYIPEVIPEHDRGVRLRAGLGQRVGFGQRIAVIVIDMCRYTVEDRSPLSCGEMGWTACRAIARLLDVARPRGIPVIYSTQRTAEPYSAATGGRLLSKAIPDDSAFATELWPHEILDEVAPQPGDVVIVKPKPSFFFGTQLASVLIHERIDTVIITGTTTAGCVRATVDDAAALNFRVIVPQEAVADRYTLSHQVTLFDIDSWLGDVMPLDDVIAHMMTVSQERVG